MPLPAKKPISRSSMRDEVYGVLLQGIMNGDLRPGEKLLDKELADVLGVSRTPVREALRRLEDKNLVETAPNRYTRVAALPFDDSEKIYPIIIALEQLAAEEAAGRMQPEDIARMEIANNALLQALDREDVAAASMADEHFHRTFVEKSGNHHLVELLQDVKIKLRWLEALYFEGNVAARQSVKEHQGIISAFQDGEVGMIQQQIRNNWEASLERLKNDRVTPNPAAPNS